jgi:hypothetical protein
MFLEDYYTALAFRAWGVPRPSKWVDELRERANMDSFKMLM